LDNKVIDITDARCIHEVNYDNFIAEVQVSLNFVRNLNPLK